MSVYPFQWPSTHTVYRCVWCVYIVVIIYGVYCYGDVVLVCIRKLRESVSSLVYLWQHASYLQLSVQHYTDSEVFKLTNERLVNQFNQSD